MKMKYFYRKSFLGGGHMVHPFLDYIRAGNYLGVRAFVVEMAKSGTSGGLKGIHYIKHK